MKDLAFFILTLNLYNEKSIKKINQKNQSKKSLVEQ